MVEQVIAYNCLVVNTCSGNLVKGFKTQAQKAAKVTGCLNDLAWRIKYMRKEQKKKNNIKKYALL